MQKEKKDQIQHVGWEVPPKLHFVPVDFKKDNLRTTPLDEGFRPQKKTFFSWLGSSMYLYRDEMEAMLQKIAALAADGSSLVFDYADAGLFPSDVKRVQNMIAMAKVGGKEVKLSIMMEQKKPVKTDITLSGEKERRHRHDKRQETGYFLTITVQV